MKKLSTQAGVGCPSCHNKKVRLVQCHNVIWKTCEKCKTIFLCKDVMTLFTDMDMKKWLAENPDKSIKDYEKHKIEWIENKYADYKKMDHPELITE